MPSDPGQSSWWRRFLENFVICLAVAGLVVLLVGVGMFVFLGGVLLTEWIVGPVVDDPYGYGDPYPERPVESMVMGGIVAVIFYICAIVALIWTLEGGGSQSADTESEEA